MRKFFIIYNLIKAVMIAFYPEKLRKILSWIIVEIILPFIAMEIVLLPFTISMLYLLYH